MATNRDLLTEAIADARAVKDTAIANAKLALEEAFTPHLKSMLAAKLDEMDKKDDEVKEEKEEVEEMDAPSFERKNSPAGDSLKDLAPRKVGQSTVQEDEVDEEINLDELLAELEDSKDIDEAKKDDDKDDIKEDERTDAEEEGYEDGMKDEKEDMEDEDIDLEDMSEDDLKGFIEDVIKDMVADGEIEPGDEFVEDEVEVEDSIEIEDVEDVDVDVEIDEAKKDEMDESEKVDEAKEEIDERKSRVKGEKGVGNEDGDKDDSKIEKETEKMRFKEAMEEIQALKVELNEVNLLNAKLLYTNKIFKAKNLTEGKKVKVLKAFDKAKDVMQAKTIFETLSEGLLDKSPINESIKKGSASKASGLEPKVAKQPIIESNDVYNRMRKLAGLI
ncbi:hypothetical protein N9L94_01225 [Robiginitalea sp.]|jgi:hypothetical protein|nr:hypothetical protein [Robiginitalea sp.]